MTTEAATAPRELRTIDAPRHWLESTRHQATAALVLYAVLAIVYFGLPVLPHLGSECACTAGSDPSGYMWNLAWWPHALLHGMNPFVTNALFVPDRINLGGEGMLVPAVAIPLAPITLLFGPIVTFNLAMLASPVLAAFFAFLLCRYVTRSFPAALVGGYLFGFSTYMLGHMLGHLNLVLVFPIPAAVHLTLRLIDGRISQRRFVVLMALTLSALLLFTTEVAFTLVVLGGLALLVAFAFFPAARGRLRGAVKPILGAGVLAALITSPMLYYGLTGNVTSGFNGVGDIYSGDALGFLVPTDVVRLGRNYFGGVAARFTAGPAEDGIYLGVPLALIVARYAITRWRLASTRLLMVMLGVVVLLVLGSHLHIAGYQTIPQPWLALDHSLLRQVVPVRLGVYVFVIVGLIASLWLAQPRAGSWGIAKWALAIVSVAFVVPNATSPAWHSRPYNPPFFTTNLYRRYIQPNETVMMLPFGQADISMLWQAETGMWFRVAGGYLGRLLPDDYVREPLLPALLPLQYGQVSASPSELRSFLARRGVRAVIVDPTEAGQWPGVLAKLGLRAESVGGVQLYRIPPGGP
jgi:hypothetical protein